MIVLLLVLMSVRLVGPQFLHRRLGKTIWRVDTLNTAVSALFAWLVLENPRLAGDWKLNEITVYPRCI